MDDHFSPVYSHECEIAQKAEGDAKYYIFCFKFEFHLEIKIPKSAERVDCGTLKSGEKFDLGSHVICWCWSPVFSFAQSKHRYVPGNFWAFHALKCPMMDWRKDLSIIDLGQLLTLHPTTHKNNV